MNNSTTTKTSEWPKLTERLDWAIDSTRAYALNGPASALLKHICYRAGTKGGCFQSQDHMAADCGIDRKTAQRAIQTLIDHGLITRAKRWGAASRITPTFVVVGVVVDVVDDSICTTESQMVYQKVPSFVPESPISCTTESQDNPTLTRSETKGLTTRRGRPSASLQPTPAGEDKAEAVEPPTPAKVKTMEPPPQSPPGSY